MPQPREAVQNNPTIDLAAVEEGINRLRNASSEERGAIFTKREVVDFILDLAGYTPDHDLAGIRLLEPSFGGGDFLLVAIERLLESWRSHGGKCPFDELRNAILAVELHEETFLDTREKIIQLLAKNNIKNGDAERLVNEWLVEDDFLLTEIEGFFDVAIGNPPYIRQELIPNDLMDAYRSRYKTIYDRADIYVPFMERSLDLLSPGGLLGFICADRWMKNRYGGPLRKKIAGEFRLRTYVDMVDTQAFHSDVIAYPAITVIGREAPGSTRVAKKPDIDKDILRVLSHSLLSVSSSKLDDSVRELSVTTNGKEPWLLESFERLNLVRRLEDNFPKIEDAGCKVGIGVATGADKAFIGKYDELDVEEDRKLPIVMTKDIDSGVVNWRGYGVINPFVEYGGLVKLQEYPLLEKYFEERRATIDKRHVAKKTPANWYRTIDRIYPDLATKPKLLIPDIKGDAQIVFEAGKYYPHHNLYYMVSDEWHLRALQAVLQSGIARLFVSTYSTRMRGGFLRFQAQYLRRIRIPHWDTVNESQRESLIAAAESGEVNQCNDAIADLYGLSEEELSILFNKNE